MNRVLMGCLITVVILIVVFFVGGFIVIFHTHVPLHIVASLLSQNEALEITGVSGSLSSGIGVEKISYKHEDGNISRVEDVAFQYEIKSDTLAIKDIHVKHAYFYVYPKITKNSKENEKKDDEFGDDTEEFGDYTETYNQSGNLIIENIDINDVTIETPSLGKKVHLDRFYLSGFEVRDEKVTLGDLVIASDYLDFSMKPLQPSEDGNIQPNSYKMQGAFKEGLHESLVQTITLSGQLDLLDQENIDFIINAVENKIQIKGTGNDQQYNLAMTVNQLTPKSYIKTMPSFQDININYIINAHKDGTSLSEEEVSMTGQFKIGKHTFTLLPFHKKDQKTKDLQTIATSESNGVRYYLNLDFDKLDKSSSPLTLISEPPESLSHILSVLMFDKSFDALNASEAELLKQEMNFYK